MGVAAARNTLLATAQGEFIAYFDDDDESYPQRLAKQWKRIVDYEGRHHCELVLCTAVRHVAINGKIDHQSTALGQAAPEPFGEMVADYFLGLAKQKGIAWGLFGTCTLMARVAAIKQLGGFDRQFRRRAEWDLAVRAAFRGAHFIAVDEPLILQNKTRGDDKAGAVPLKYALMLRQKYKDYLTERRVYFASKAMAISDFHKHKGRFFLGAAYALLACVSSPAFLWQKFARIVESSRRGEH
jgi:glycosyltransferase involved in cell wall biosynthesis